MAKRVEVRVRVAPATKAAIDAQVRLGHFRDAGDCVDALLSLHRSHSVRTHKQLLVAIQEAERSGPARELTRSDLEELRQTATRRGAALRQMSAELRKRRSA